jgi:hypothetical protein
MITNILRLIESVPAVPRYLKHQLSATAGSSALALRLKNLMLKTSHFPPQNRLQPVFVKQEEFVFCERRQSKLQPR